LEGLSTQLAGTLASIAEKLDQVVATRPAQKRKPRARRAKTVAAE
jgi:hypothetical protein